MIQYANGSKDIFNNTAIQQKTEQSSNNEIPLELIKTEPEYPGGAKALESYIAQNLRYPKKTQKDGIQGEVIVRFLVKENGSISDIKIFKSLTKNCDFEAERIVSNMKKWIPAKLNGKPVKTYHTLSIIFKL